MEGESVDIVRVIRRLRGSSQAYHVEGHDGHHYAAKFAQNPQGTRTLINEWFAHQFLRRLGISTSPIRVLRLSPAISKELAFERGATHTAIKAGLHFGSQFPAHPSTSAIYDFLPQKVLSRRLTNPEDFAKVSVLDWFFGQTENRQAVFVREKTGQMRAYMIDQGGLFGGRFWRLPGSCCRHQYFDRTVYSLCDLSEECGRTLQKVSALTDQDLQQAGESVPSVWFSQQDRAAWAQLLSQLSSRKSQLPEIGAECLQTAIRKPSNYRTPLVLPKNAVRNH
jgi:hypothetical protein